MPALGCALVGLGVAGDSRGWWESRSFLTNLASSFTGLMFAVPFALVVLSRIGEAHAELADRRAAARQAERDLRRFNETVSGLRPARDSLTAMIASYRAQSETALARRSAGQIRETERRRIELGIWEEFCQSSRRLVLGRELQVDAMEAQWNMIRDSLSPRLSDNNLMLHFTGDASWVLGLGSPPLVIDDYGNSVLECKLTVKAFRRNDIRLLPDSYGALRERDAVFGYEVRDLLAISTKWIETIDRLTACGISYGPTPSF